MTISRDNDGGSLVDARIEDIVRRTRYREGMLAGEFASSSPSDKWTQLEVYTHVYMPLAEAVLVLAERLEGLHTWASRMPDAGFSSESPRWGWWHERPR